MKGQRNEGNEGSELIDTALTLLPLPSDPFAPHNQLFTSIALLLEIGVFIAFFRVVFGISPSVQFYALGDNFVQCLLWLCSIHSFRKRCLRKRKHGYGMILK